MNTHKPRSLSLYLLMTLLLFQGISGLYGGAALVLDPTGGMLQMPLSLLDGSPFETYMIPGIILSLVLGVYPIIVLYGIWKQKRWAWSGAILTSIALIIWIGVEIAMIGYHTNPPLQLIYGLTGLALLVLALLPEVRATLKSQREKQ